ncbi:hypothetical protein G3V68_23805 [Escherichia coli]|nr:hypothetical protein [Escherichia coli]
MNANAHDYRLNPQVHEDQWISCEKCRDYMLPLAKFEVESSGFASPDRDDLLDNSLGGWGWIHFLALAAFGLFVTLYEEIALVFRRRKLQRLKADILPKHPKSQVCPKCLQVKRLV